MKIKLATIAQHLEGRSLVASKTTYLHPKCFLFATIHIHPPISARSGLYSRLDFSRRTFHIEVDRVLSMNIFPSTQVDLVSAIRKMKEMADQATEQKGM